MVAAGEVARCEFAEYPNVCAWLARMKALPSWKKIHEAISGYATSLKDQPMVTL
jgi:glutathione S-transferase